MKRRTLDLRKLSSAMKYPSIPTYHRLGERGRLRDELDVSFGADPIVLTEKIDGTNARIVLFPGGDFVIGSREELLHARDDRVANPAQGIVEATKIVAVRFAESPVADHAVVTVFGEVYGGKTTASKAYGTAVGFRVFDVVRMPEAVFDGLMTLSLEEIARWRDDGGQRFAGEDEIARVAALAGVDVTPRLEGTAPPVDVRATADWLARVLPGETRAPLDGERKGKPEGVVVRTRDRTKIAKVRFEDYERTLR